MAVDKIIDQILADAAADAEQILVGAKAKAQKIRKDAEEEAEAKVREVRQKSDNDLKGFESKVESSIEMHRRRATLAARQEMINEVIDRAYTKLNESSDKEYFEMLMKLLVKNVQPRDGELALSEKDLGRLPKDFEKRADEAARSAGGSLKLCSRPYEIDNGFILIYGDIEENCSLRAVFDAGHDELVDLVNEILS